MPPQPTPVVAPQPPATIPPAPAPAPLTPAQLQAREREEDRARAAQKHPEILRDEQRRAERREKEKAAAEQAALKEGIVAGQTEEQVKAAFQKLSKGREAVTTQADEALAIVAAARTILEKRQAQLTKDLATLGDIEGTLVSARDTGRHDPERALPRIRKAGESFEAFAKPFRPELDAELERRKQAKRKAAQ